MAKPRSVEAKLTRLHALRHEPISASVAAELRQFLGDASNLVVSEAAALAGQSGARELAAELVAAFHRMMIDPEESDKQCRGKIAIVEALNALEYSEPEVFLRGITHVQNLERNSPNDAAGPLRACCALGLARLAHPGLILLLTDRLVYDKDKAARVGIVRALSGLGSLAAVPLLRYKALIGDLAGEVVSECFTSLLAMAPDDSLPFVARFLKHADPEVRGGAVIALAETRKPEAFATLERFWPSAPDDLKETVLLGMAMFRSPAAIEFLVGIVAQKGHSARAALSALAIHRHNEKIKATVAAAVQKNGDPDLLERFKKKFPDNIEP